MNPGEGRDHDWDVYWRNSRFAAAHGDGAPQDAVLERFWAGLFERSLYRLPPAARMLDVCCGGGAVVGHALRAVDAAGSGRELLAVGVDTSHSAVANLRSRHARARGVAADAAALPFADGAFHVVTSQFGLEYAAPGALAEAARVSARTGLIALVLHLKDGGIYRECAANRDAANGFRDSNLLGRFRELYRAAAALQAGRADRQAFQAADRNLAAAVAACEDVLRRCGRGIADGMLFRLYSDVGHMYRRLGTHDLQEIEHWIHLTGTELDSYAGRMAAMLAAAADEGGLERRLQELGAHGFVIRVRSTLSFGPRALPCAWVIVAERAGGSA